MITPPFNSNSIWNRKIPTNVALTPNSSQQITLLSRAISGAINVDGINGAWSVPINYADTDLTNPTVLVPVYDTAGNATTALVPVPLSVKVSPDDDAKCTIIDFTAVPRRGWSFWRFHKDLKGLWCVDKGAFGYAILDSTGDGITNHEGGSWGGRVAGWNYLAGLILPEEISQGHIDHALLLNIPSSVASNTSIWPAKASDGTSISINAIPIGSHIQLDPLLDVSTLPLTAGGKVVARALQVYGAWVGDTGVAAAFNAQEFIGDNGQVTSAPWAGLLASNSFYNNVLPIEKLRVLQTNSSDYFQEVITDKVLISLRVDIYTSGHWIVTPLT